MFYLNSSPISKKKKKVNSAILFTKPRKWLCLLRLNFFWSYIPNIKIFATENSSSALFLRPVFSISVFIAFYFQFMHLLIPLYVKVQVHIEINGGFCSSLLAWNVLCTHISRYVLWHVVKLAEFWLGKIIFWIAEYSLLALISANDLLITVLVAVW